MFSKNRHLNVCKTKLVQNIQDKKDEKIQQLELTIQTLNEKIEYLCSICDKNKLAYHLKDDTKPITFLFKKKRVKTIFKSLNFSKANVLSKYKELLIEENKVLYWVGDVARKIFYFYDENGTKFKDIRCTRLIKETFKTIKTNLHNQFDKLYAKQISENSESSDSSTEVDSDEARNSFIKTKSQQKLLDKREITLILDFIQSSEFPNKIMMMVANKSNV